MAMRISFILLLMAIVALSLILLGSVTHQEKCLVWKNVEEKFESNGNFIAITDQPLPMLLPVDNETYSFVKVNQSYNFYCDKSLLRDWKCHTSYECGEMSQ